MKCSLIVGCLPRKQTSFMLILQVIFLWHQKSISVSVFFHSLRGKKQKNTSNGKLQTLSITFVEAGRGEKKRKTNFLSAENKPLFN